MAIIWNAPKIFVLYHNFSYFFSYCISVRYFVTNGYSWFDFLEYPMVMSQMVFLVTLSIIYTNKATFKDVALVIGTYVIFFYSISPRSVTFPGPVILKLCLVSDCIKSKKLQCLLVLLILVVTQIVSFCELSSDFLFRTQVLLWVCLENLCISELSLKVVEAI